MKFISLVTFSLVFFFACTSKEKALVAIKDFEFNSGFNSGNAKIVQVDGMEYFCVADFNTQKTIAMHAIDNSSEHFVPLDSVIFSGEKILDYDVIGTDSILVLTYYTNQLYMINQKGEIWRKLELNAHLKTDDYYNFLSMGSTIMLNDTSCLLAAVYARSNISPELISDMTFEEQVEFQMKETRKRPSLLFIENIFADSLKMTLHLPGLLNRYLERDELDAGSRRFTNHQDRITFHSPFMDSIYVLDTKTFEVVDIQAITSNFGEVGLVPVKVADFENDMELVNKVYMTGGRLRGIVFDPYRNYYYCSFIHKPETTNDKSWSLLILDDELNKIDEIPMDETQYASLFFVTQEGILIYRYNEASNNPDDLTKNAYTLFRYE